MDRYQGVHRTAKLYSFICMGVIGMLLAAVVAQGAEPLLSEKLMPADPIIALVIRDASATEMRWQTTALHEVFSDPEMKAMMEPLCKTLNDLFATGKSMSPVPFEPLNTLVTGETGLSVSLSMNARGPEPVVQLVFIPGDLPKAKGELNKVLNTFVEMGAFDQQSDDGRTRAFSVDDGFLSVTCDADAVLLTASAGAGTQLHAELLQRKDAHAAGLSGDSEYAAVRSRIDDDFDGWIYIGAIPWMQRNMPGMNPLAPMLAMNGLDDYRGMIAGVRIEDRGFRTRAFVKRNTDPAAAESGMPQVSSTDLAQIPADVQSFTIGAVDLVAAYDMITSWLMMVPQGGEVARAITEIEERTGLNLRNDILAMFDKRFMTYLPEEGSPAGPGLSAFLRIKDRQVAAERFKKALEGIVTVIREEAAGPQTDSMVRVRSLDRGDFTQVYLQSILPSIITPNLTVTDDWVGLNFSARSALPRTRYLLDKEKKNVLARKNFADVYAKIPTRCHFIHYEDVGANFDNVIVAVQLLSDIGVAVAKIAALQGELPVPVDAGEMWGMDPGRFPDNALLRDKLFGSVAIISYEPDGTLFESFSPIGPLPVLTRRWRSGGALQKVAITSMLAGMTMPALARARGEARTAVCKENLSQIGKALYAWMMNHDEALPDSLEALMPEYIANRRVFYCPNASGPTSHYAYIGAIPGNVMGELRSDTIIAYDLAGNHPGRRNVLNLDGAVPSMDEFRFQAQLQMTKERVEAAFKAEGLEVPESTRKFLNDEVGY